MRTVGERVADQLREARERLGGRHLAPVEREVGIVEAVGSGIATVRGLPSVRLDELLVLGGGSRGLAVVLDEDRVGVTLLDRPGDVVAGSEVRGTNEVVRVPVGEALLGRIVDPLGRPLDGGLSVAAVRHDPIEQPAPAILDRDLVTEPLHTGVLSIDAMVPLGRGQRELVIGDRSTGKTAIALDAILSQRSTDVICVYVAVGQKASAVGRLIEEVKLRGRFDRCIFVLAEADDPAGLQWIAPYAACTMAEHFRDKGGHALLVLDDLSKHAVVHRELALLLRNPPGREAYPGDVFYLHARLLERAAKLAKERSGGSLTALAIAETQGGNMTAYIPTNLISITDGQIVLDAALFHEGQKPAVNIGKSVSRVGGQTQPVALRDLAGRMRLEYAQFLELEVFSRFGQVLDPRSERVLDHGRRIRAVLEQAQSAPYSLSAEVALLTAVREGVLDALPLDRVPSIRSLVGEPLATERPELVKHIEETGRLTDDDRKSLLEWLRLRTGASPAAAREPGE
jgi:F-type H+-transporting ATPase subunit alpha